jgi:hypothetical protein
MSDYLATVVAVTEAWEQALGLLVEHINAFLRDRRTTPSPNLDEAFGKLTVAVHRLRAFHPIRDSFPWLVVGALPVHSTATVEYQLRQCAAAADKAGVELTTTWLSPSEPAEAIRAWLMAEKTKALAATLSPRQWNALQALAELSAFGPDSRVTAEEIARQTEDCPPDTFKRPLRDLVNTRLIASTGSRGGAGGGYWLTAEGRAVLQRRPG